MKKFFKRFLLSLALFTLAININAQDTVDYINIIGRVVTTQLEPVSYHSVEITGKDSTSVGFWTLFSGSDSEGNFLVKIPSGDSDQGGSLNISTQGFFGETIDTTVFYYPDSAQNFYVTLYLPTIPVINDCEAFFIYSHDAFNEQLIHFNNLSENFTEVYWDFGDGHASTYVHPTHNYAPGDYTVCLTVSNPEEQCEDQYCANISIKTPSNCNSNFDYILLDNCAVDFEAVLSDTSASCFWDFGDGTVDSGKLVFHQYDFEGAFEVTLTTVDDDYCMFSTTKTVVVRNEIMCNADFTYVQDESLLQKFTFSDVSEGDVAERIWMMDEIIISTDSVFSIILPAGDHDICIYTIDTLTGCEDSHCQQVYSPYYNCNADFTFGSDALLVDFAALNNSPYPVSYQWDFGDGSKDEGAEVSHRYFESGDYTVVLTSVDSLGCNSEIQKLVKVSTQSDLEALFSWEYIAGAEKGILFTNQTSGSFDQVMWSFGDETHATEISPEHYFEQDGVYQVCLSVTNSDNGAESSYCDNIIIPENYCQADFTYTVDGFLLSLEASSESPYAVDFEWDYGDGHIGEGLSVSHLYATNGTYTIKLTATDSLGCISIVEKDIPIDPAHCVANFAAEMDTLDVFIKAVFTNLSEGAYDEVYWDFGDGFDSRQDNPEHIYAEAGTYTVCLTIISDYCEDKVCKDIVVPEYVPSLAYNIAGQVFAGFFPAADASVYLIRKYEEYYITIDTCAVNEDGIYYFYQAPAGEYLLRARPQNAYEDEFVAAYYDADFNWENAEVLNLNQDNFKVDISLLPKEQFANGVGFIKGDVFYTEGLRLPAEGVEIFLLNDNYNALEAELSYEDGSFAFDAVGEGSYWVYAEVPGKVTHPLYVELIPEEMTQDDLKITINYKDVTYIRDDLTSYQHLQSWPNPATDYINIAAKELDAASVQIVIVNSIGQQVKHLQMAGSSSALQFDVHDLTAGFYSYIITTSSGFNAKGVFVKK